MNIHDHAQKIARSRGVPVSQVLSELGRRKRRNRTRVESSGDLRAVESPQGWLRKWEDGR